MPKDPRKPGTRKPGANKTVPTKELDTPKQLRNDKWPTYVLLMNITSEGAKHVDHLSQHSDALFDMVDQLGGSLNDYWVTLGPHDIVAIVTLPDEESAVHLSALIALQGWVTVVTLRAHSLRVIGPHGHM